MDLDNVSQASGIFGCSGNYVQMDLGNSTYIDQQQWGVVLVLDYGGYCFQIYIGSLGILWRRYMGNPAAWSTWKIISNA